MRAKQLEEFTVCLQQERYYDAHEALEVLWFTRRFEESAEVKLLKGLINAAVSFELIKRERILQSKKVWANYLKYRQNLYKINAPYLNEYYKLTRYVEEINKNKLKNL